MVPASGIARPFRFVESFYRVSRDLRNALPWFPRPAIHLSFTTPTFIHPSPPTLGVLLLRCNHSVLTFIPPLCVGRRPPMPGC